MAVSQLLDDDTVSNGDDTGVGPVRNVNEDIDKLRAFLGRAEDRRQGFRGGVCNSGILGVKGGIEPCGSFVRRGCRAIRLPSFYARHRESAGT